MIYMIIVRIGGVSGSQSETYRISVCIKLDIFIKYSKRFSCKNLFRIIDPGVRTVYVTVWSIQNILIYSYSCIGIENYCCFFFRRMGTMKAIALQTVLSRYEIEYIFHIFLFIHFICDCKLSRFIYRFCG